MITWRWTVPKRRDKPFETRVGVISIPNPAVMLVGRRLWNETLLEESSNKKLILLSFRSSYFMLDLVKYGLIKLDKNGEEEERNS